MMNRRMRRIALTSLVLLAVMVVPSLSGVVPARGASAAAPASWTIALYIDADNTLATSWTHLSLPLLEAVPASSKVNIVAMVAEKGAGNVVLEKISGSSVTVVETDPSMDMGLGSTLTWWIDKYTALWPSTYNSLVLWDHGWGWHYICTDDVYGDRINMTSLQSAITNAGKTIDVLSFDACNMAAYEVAYQVSQTNLVTYVVASEETEYDYGVPYNLVLTPLIKNPATLPKGLAMDFVDGYQQYYTSVGNGWQKATCYTAIDVSKLKAATSTFTAWVTEMKALLPSYSSYYATALKNAHTMLSCHYTDVGTYMAALLATSGVTDATLRTDTQKVLSSQPSYIVKVYDGTTMTSCTGITFYLPNNSDWKWNQPDYMQLAFAVDTGWGSFLASYTAK